jgi:hypothetical protein
LTWKLDVVPHGYAPKVFNKIFLWARHIILQGGAKQSAVGLFHGDSQQSRLASQLTHYRRLDVGYEELGQLELVIGWRRRKCK